MEATDEASDEATDEVSDEATEEASDEATDEASDEATDEASDELTAATANLALEPRAEPVAIWLTEWTPQPVRVPLPTAAVHIRAYGLGVPEQEGNFKVVSSFDTEWDGEGKKCKMFRLCTAKTFLCAARSLTSFSLHNGVLVVALLCIASMHLGSHCS